MIPVKTEIYVRPISLLCCLHSQQEHFAVSECLICFLNPQEVCLKCNSEKIIYQTFGHHNMADSFPLKIMTSFNVVAKTQEAWNLTQKNYIKYV